MIILLFYRWAWQEIVEKIGIFFTIFAAPKIFFFI